VCTVIRKNPKLAPESVARSAQIRSSTKCRSDSLRSQRRRGRERSKEIAVFRSADEVQETGFIGGTKVEAFEYLENILSWRKSEAQEEE
jgi:hypothetical protein